MHPSIPYPARLGVTETRVDNVIKFLDSHYIGLGRGGQFNNGYDFLKKCLTISRIL